LRKHFPYRTLLSTCFRVVNERVRSIVTAGLPAAPIPNVREDDLRSAGSGPVDPVAATVLRPLPFRAVRLTDGFLARLQAENAGTSIAGGHEHLERERAWVNFENAAARRVGEPYFGPVFEDGEAFKWLESVAWEHGRRPAEDLGEWLDRYSALARDAQDGDGYLATFNQTAGKRGRYEWISYDHEIFNMATMIQAAVAHYRATGRTVLLDVARRAADHLDATFGWGKREELCGHPLIEMALVELYRVCGERRFLDLASYFVERRGHGTLTDPTGQHWTSIYFSDRIPVRETVYPEGHAVRAVYFASGATDVAVETGDAELLSALRRQWENMVAAKMFVNGSLGARWEGEAFGDPYELPTDRGYGETCAAIASTQWSWRLLLATGEAKYADLIERQFYNAVLSGVSLDGNKYFYVNALQVREGAIPYDSRMPARGRQEWFGCSCCPTNLMRTIAAIHHYVATATDEGVQLHQFAPGEVRAGGVALRIRTGYPWDGDVTIEVGESPEPEWELAVRVPSWADGAVLEVGGSPVRTEAGGYARIRRAWRPGDVVALRLPMAPRAVRGHHRVDAVRGSVAIERGPLVYAIEQVDQAAGVAVDDVELTDHEFAVEQRDDILGGVPTVRLHGRVGPDGPAADVVAVPYFMWANREVGPMKVWLPASKDAK
jgi:DUF1680 family protein